MKPTKGLALGGRYRLVRQIAVGGMGEVWVAHDLSLARDVAAKVLREEYAGNKDFLDRLRTEARNSAALSHTNIAQLFDYGEEQGSGYLVMELIVGEPMSDLLEREPVLPPQRLLPILAQTARGLHAAHVAGVVHRDVKPGNILLEHGSQVKITDFGVSLSANQIPMTASGMVMGTAQYLSPEQAIGKPATGASDIYALGIVAYESLAGKRPFTGPTPVDIAVAHVNEKVPPLPETVHPELAGLVMQMLAKDPVQRPRSAATLARILDELAESLALDPWPGTAARRAARPSADDGGAPAPGAGVPVAPDSRSAPAPATRAAVHRPASVPPGTRTDAPIGPSRRSRATSAAPQTPAAPSSPQTPAVGAPPARRSAERPAPAHRSSGAPARRRSGVVPPTTPVEQVPPAGSPPPRSFPPSGTPQARRRAQGGQPTGSPAGAARRSGPERGSAGAGAARRQTPGSPAGRRRDDATPAAPGQSRRARPRRTSTTTGLRPANLSWPLIALVGILLVLLLIAAVDALTGSGDDDAQTAGTAAATLSEAVSGAPPATAPREAGVPVPDVPTDGEHSGMIEQAEPQGPGPVAPTTSKDE